MWAHPALNARAWCALSPHMRSGKKKPSHLGGWLGAGVCTVGDGGRGGGGWGSPVSKRIVSYRLGEIKAAIQFRLCRHAPAGGTPVAQCGWKQPVQKHGHHLPDHAVIDRKPENEAIGGEATEEIDSQLDIEVAWQL